MKGFFREFGETEEFEEILETSGKIFRPIKEIFVAKTKHPCHC